MGNLEIHQSHTVSDYGDGNITGLFQYQNDGFKIAERIYDVII